MRRACSKAAVPAILLVVLIGGPALNLTPCVLPMVPINLAIIGAGAQAGSRHRGFMLGLAYGAAMAVVYGVLGLIVADGKFVRHHQRLALVQSRDRGAVRRARTRDVRRDQHRLPGLSNNVKAGGSQGSMALAFTMGGIAALLAGACVAPVVIQVVLFSSNLYAAGTKAALALPFVLGVGMAIPWPIAGAGLSACRSRARGWSASQAFGVIIIGTALYYGYEAYDLFSSRWVDATEVASSVQEKLKAGWQPLARRWSGAGRTREQAGAHRHVGHLVQELPGDGPHDARRSGGDQRSPAT